MKYIGMAILILAAFFLFFFRLGYFPFLDYDDATYALVTVETLESGDPLTLIRHGQPWFDKPPLYF